MVVYRCLRWRAEAFGCRSLVKIPLKNISVIKEVKYIIKIYIIPLRFTIALLISARNIKRISRSNLFINDEITLFSGEIGKIPNHFSDKESLIVKIVKRLKIFRHKIDLEIFRPNP